MYTNKSNLVIKGFVTYVGSRASFHNSYLTMLLAATKKAFAHTFPTMHTKFFATTGQ